MDHRRYPGGLLRGCARPWTSHHPRGQIECGLEETDLSTQGYLHPHHKSSASLGAPGAGQYRRLSTDPKSERRLGVPDREPSAFRGW